jgi:hypothetical protein
MSNHEESQKMLGRKMIAFVTQMKKYDEEVAQPDSSLQQAKTWDEIALPADTINKALSAMGRYEALSAKDQKTIIETIGDGLDDTFFTEEEEGIVRKAKEQQQYVARQAEFLVKLIIKLMQDDVADEILNAPVDVEGLKRFAEMAAEEKEDKKARTDMKKGVKKTG